MTYDPLTVYTTNTTVADTFLKDAKTAKFLDVHLDYLTAIHLSDKYMGVRSLQPPNPMTYDPEEEKKIPELRKVLSLEFTQEPGDAESPSVLQIVQLTLDLVDTICKLKLDPKAKEGADNKWTSFVASLTKESQREVEAKAQERKFEKDKAEKE